MRCVTDNAKGETTWDRPSQLDKEYAKSLAREHVRASTSDSDPHEEESGCAMTTVDDAPSGINPVCVTTVADSLTRLDTQNQERFVTSHCGELMQFAEIVLQFKEHKQVEDQVKLDEIVRMEAGQNALRAKQVEKVAKFESDEARIVGQRAAIDAAVAYTANKAAEKNKADAEDTLSQAQSKRTKITRKVAWPTETKSVTFAVLGGASVVSGVLVLLVLLGSSCIAYSRKQPAAKATNDMESDANGECSKLVTKPKWAIDDLNKEFNMPVSGLEKHRSVEEKYRGFSGAGADSESLANGTCPA